MYVIAIERFTMGMGHLYRMEKLAYSLGEQFNEKILFVINRSTKTRQLLQSKNLDLLRLAMREIIGK